MKTNIYIELKKRQQQRMSDFLDQYAFFAFNNDQLEKGLQKLGATKEDIVSIGAGGFITADQVQTYCKMLMKHAAERQEALDNPETGAMYAFQMFLCELADHEYTWTQDTEETLEALGYTNEDVESNPKLKAALKKAMDALNGEN